MEARAENLMVGGQEICPNLQEYYNIPAAKKQKYLETPEAKFLFANLPKDVGKILLEGFLLGVHGVDMLGWNMVLDYFHANSRIIPALYENPGTFTMLEKMYHFQPVRGEIDTYFKMGMAGGQALRNRFDTVTNYAIAHVNEVIAERGFCLMVDIGSGPGRNGVDMCLRNPTYRSKLRIDCVDIDSKAIAKGKWLAIQHQLSNISFVQENMVRLNGRYEENVDYGIIIGVLCGMIREHRVKILRKIRPYFRSGARLVAASLLEEMAKKDLLCAYILRETADWQLQYPPLGELKGVFEEAGWRYEGYFQDEPTRFYEIGIGVAP